MENQGLNLEGVSIEKILSGVTQEQSTPASENISEQTTTTQVEEKEESTEEVEQVQQPTATEETEKNSVEEDSEVGSNEAPVESIFSEINTFMGVDIDSSGYQENVEGFASYTKDLSNQMADGMLENIFNAFPDVKDYLDIRMAGGNAEKFVQSFVNSEKLGGLELQDNESQWENLVAQHYQSTGMGEDDVQAMINDFKDTGILRSQAERSLKFLKSQKQRELENVKEREIQEYQQREQQLQQQWKEIEGVVSDGHIKGLVIPQKERSKFYNWMSAPDAEGKTEAMARREQMDTETAVAIEYLLYKNFDFGTLASNINKTKKAQDLRSRLKGSNSTSSRMGNKKGYTPAKTKGFNSIQDILKS
jgi:L-rhamnose mutarotase